MSVEAEVRQASEKFYAGLNHMANGDASALAHVWSHSESATAMHPIGGREMGWSAIKASFDQVADLASAGRVELADQSIQVIGDVAYEIGVEQGELTLGGHHATIEHRVTNIYQREDGAWKMIHHHTDTSPAMLDVLGKL